MILGWLPADVSTFGPNIDSMLKLIIYVVGTAFVLAESALILIAGALQAWGATSLKSTCPAPRFPANHK